MARRRSNRQSHLRVIPGDAGGARPDPGATVAAGSAHARPTGASADAYDADRTWARPRSEPGSVPLPAAELTIGATLSGRYRLEKILGEGGMGRVYLATDLLFAEEFHDRRSAVAIKVLGRKFADHPDARMALQREASRTATFAHPNVVKVTHFALDGPHAYMIMEYMNGRPLDEFIRSRPTGVPLPEALPMIEGMAAGLSYIHRQGIVHSDFKPGNVFVGDDRSVKVLDLGIARAVEGVGGTGPDTAFDASLLGALSPVYAACEIFERQPADPRDDLYALGCVVYELLTGHHPFNGAWAIHARAQQLRPQRVAGIGNRRWRALEQTLEFERAARTATAEAFLEALRGDRLRQRRIVTGLGTLALAGMGAAAAFGMLAIRPPDPDQRFLENLKPATPAPLSAKEQAAVARWLEQGTVYLEVARSEFEQGSLATAHRVLKGGADNAYWAFASVADRIDSEAARQGLLEIVNTYADWADATSRQGRLEDALWAACQGLAIHREHERSKALAAQISGQIAEGRSAPVPGCERLSGSVSPPSSGDGPGQGT